MSETALKHTPGPWSRRKGKHSLIPEGDIVNSEGDCIALLDSAGGMSGPDEIRANGILIQFAPDLLAANILQEAAEEHWANCEECQDATCPELGCETAFKMADDARISRREAIASATGVPIAQEEEKQ